MRSTRPHPLASSPALQAALLAAGPALLVYLRTVSPTITGFDAGDLATSSYTLGIAHPPGYPLYTLLGRVFALLVPIGDVGFRFALFSALSGTLAVGLTAALLASICGAVLPAAIAAWTLAFSATFWSQCVVTEVYALNCAFFALVWLLLVRWGEKGSARSLFLAAFVYGLGLAHHLSLTMSAPAIAAYVLWRRTRAPFRWSWIPLLAAFLLLGPCLYFYLIIRAQHDPAYNFDRPDTWPRFWFHVRAKTYYFRLVALTSDIWLRRFLGVGRVIVQELGWVGCIGAVAGLILLVRRARVFAVLTLLVVAFYAAYTAAYRIPDIRVYYLPVILILAIPLAALLAGLARALRHRVLVWAALLAATALPVSGLVRNWTENDFHDSRLVRAWVEARQNMATDGGRVPATLLILSDTDLFTSAYLQIVEKKHPELHILDLAGNIYDDIYGLWGKDKVGTLIPDELRWRVEKAVVDSARAKGQRAYYIPHPDYYLTGYDWTQRGFLFEATPAGTPIDTTSVWHYLPDISSYERRGSMDRESRVVVCNIYMLRGEIAAMRKDERTALAYWDRANRLAGDLVDVHMGLSRFYLTAGRKEQAIAACKRVIALEPDDGNAYSNYADVLMAMRDTTQAIRMYEEALRVNGYLMGVQFIRLANASRMRGHADKAILYYRHALSVQPSDARGWAALASLYVQTRDLDRAAYCNRRAIDLNPQYAEAYGNLGFVYLNLGRLQEAETVLLESRRLKPSEPQTLMNLGVVYTELKQPDKAREALSELVRVAPSFPRAHYQYGALAAAQGDLATAAREFRAEIAANPRNTAALGELGIVESQMGHGAQAAALWEQLLRIAPGDARAHFNLAVYYTNAGQRDRAIAHYRQVLTIVPEGDVAVQARAALQKLGG